MDPHRHRIFDSRFAIPWPNRREGVIEHVISHASTKSG